MKKTNSFNIASMVLGILSIASSVMAPSIGIIAGITGLVFAVKTKEKDSYSRTGFVTSIIGIALSVIFWIIMALIYMGALGTARLK